MGFFNSILFVILPITFLFYQSIFHLPIVSAKDTLMPGDELLFNYTIHSSSSTLFSSNGKFTLGFFTISTFTWDTSSAINLTYLGIWYTNDQIRRVWVANRDLPILGAAILLIDDSGILKVKSESGATLFNVSDDKVGSSNNTRALLHDSGNFIVYDEANRTIWLMFHLPIVSAKDTLMPDDELLFNYTIDSSSSTFFSSNGIFTYVSAKDMPYVLPSYSQYAKNDTLMPGDELQSSSTLVSSNGKFTLGFFTISPHTIDTSSAINLTYLGIWFTNEQESKRVWVANRDLPILGTAILILDYSGILKVTSESGATLFNVSDDKVGSSGNPRAMLQDSGNFIVYDEANRTIWKSFDYPTDTLIPGMKLGYNLTTKKNWELTSAAINDVPTSGAFTMRLEHYQNSPQLLIYRRGELYWASGPWNKSNGTFPMLFNVPAFDMVLDPSGMYLIVKTTGASGIPRLQLSPSGHFNDYTPYICNGSQGEDDYGCVDPALPHCRARALALEIDGYHWEIHSFYNGRNKTDDNSSISLGDCMEKCWKDCTCTACSTYNNNGTGCIYWTDNSSISLGQLELFVYVLVPSPKKNISGWILFSLAIVPVLVIAYVMIKIRIIKGKENRRRDELILQLAGSNSFNYGDELERGIQGAPDVKIFSLKAILAAINNFSEENKLGQGGYGPVYKGELSDGRKIAVKRLSKTSRQGILEFKSELVLISKLQHTNLVRLYGCCIHQEEKMLIYEFMPNKSLDFFLFDDDKKEKIDWWIRFKIIEGIAQGLLYLHKYSRMRVIHRDLKVSNVLLDENMNPKIADFGMAKIFQPDVSEAMTNRVVGTYGYMAPEYVMHGSFSIKSDVFSFGVLILEIVSGKKNSSFHHLLRHAWELWKREASLELKDEAFGESYDVKQLLRVVHVGLLCVQDNANDRPTISEVISMLNNEIADLPSPKQPPFFIHPDEVQQSRSTEHLSENNIQGSVNGLTVTTMEAR